MTRKNLIIIHRGERYDRDFSEIAEKVFALDESITTYFLGCHAREQIPEAEWRYPTLVVALAPTFQLQIQRGHVIRNRLMPKTEQAERARKAGVAVPAIAQFEFGMKLDPILYGAHVVLKPVSINSTGDGVHLFRRSVAETLKPSDFPRRHPIHRDRKGYLVQRYIDTGPRPNSNRVTAFLGEPIYAAWYGSLSERPPLDSPDHVLANATIAIQGSARERIWRIEDDVMTEMRKVCAAFPDVGLLAIDFLREEKTGRLFFIECNPGGNTWHFSSDQKGGINIRMTLGEAHIHGEEKANELGRLRMIEQFGAWDVAAKALVAKVHELAC